MSWSDVTHIIIYVNGISGSKAYDVAKTLEEKGYGIIVDANKYLYNKHYSRQKALVKTMRKLMCTIEESNVILVGDFVLLDEKMLRSFTGWYKVITLVLDRDIEDCFKDSEETDFETFQKKVKKEAAWDVSLGKCAIAVRYPYNNAVELLNTYIDKAERLWKIC